MAAEALAGEQQRVGDLLHPPPASAVEPALLAANPGRSDRGHHFVALGVVQQTSQGDTVSSATARGRGMFIRSVSMNSSRFIHDNAQTMSIAAVRVRCTLSSLCMPACTWAKPRTASAA